MVRNKINFMMLRPFRQFMKDTLIYGVKGLLLVCFCMANNIVHAETILTTDLELVNDIVQDRVVKGRILDANGEPLPGVNIVIKGTSTGLISDISGYYSIEIPSGLQEPVVLVYSFVGYESVEVEVVNQVTIDVTMQVETMGMEEVVVIGYGSQKRANLTAAISSVNAEEITQLPMARTDQALQGRTSGVYVLNTDGSPGGETMIRIRGLNSINGGNQPLIVVDGLQGADITSLNPQDIASMEILKDASATAIYGSRGGNGVILITTKLGRIGKPVIDANFSYGVQSLARKLPVMTAGEYAGVVNEYRMTNTADGNIPVPVFTPSEIAQFERDGGTDWQDEVFETGYMSNNQLSVSGATESLKYLVSANYLDHNGILKNSQYNRISLRTNLAADIAKWVDFGLNYAFTKEMYESPEFREFSVVPFVAQTLNTAVRFAPTEPVYNEDGTYHRHSPLHGPSDTWNPLASAIEPDLNRLAYRNNAYMFLNFKLAKGLSLKASGGALITNKQQNDYYGLETMNGLEHNGEYFGANSIYERYQNSNILTYASSWSGNHQLMVTGVMEQVYERGAGSNIEARDFLVDQLSYNNLQGASILFPSSWANERTLLSYLGRVNYGFAGRYLFTATYRADASSVFGDDHKWGYFPSASAAWRISEEEFLSGASAIQDLKLRASWGKTGNQAIGPYQSLARLSSGQGDYGPNYPYDGLSSTNTGFIIDGLANPDLKWETTTQTNIGMDLVMLRGRLTSTIDVYKKVTEDLLMPRELPGYVGIGSVLSNVGSVENKGLEIQIGGDPVVGNFKWNTSVNLTINRNKVLDLGGDDRISYSTTPGGVCSWRVYDIGSGSAVWYDAWMGFPGYLGY